MTVQDLEKLRDKQGFINLNQLSNIQTENISASNAIATFCLSDGKIIFKNYSKAKKDTLIEVAASPNMAYYEVLYYAISKKYGVRCAKYDFARYKDMEGTISYDLNNNTNKKYCTLTEFIWRNFIGEDVKSSWFEIELKYSGIHELTELFSAKFEKEYFLDELLAMVTLDVILGHSDKQPLNIMIETDLNGQQPHIYSIDSSHILTQLNEEQLKERFEAFTWFFNGLNEERKSRIYSFIQDFNVKDVYGIEPLKFYKKNSKLQRIVEPIISRNRAALLQAIIRNRGGKINKSFNISVRRETLKAIKKFDEDSKFPRKPINL